MPKALITCALIPPIMNMFFGKKSVAEGNTYKPKLQPQKDLTFTGLQKEPLTKTIGKILDTNVVQKLANKGKDTNYAMHITALTDTATTAAFIGQTKKSRKIDEDRKQTLINNSAISTGLSIASTYVLDRATKKPTEKFIENFKQANKESPKLDKYVEGIKIAKPMLILGTIYYCAIPFISTFFAERLNNNSKTKA